MSNLSKRYTMTIVRCIIMIALSLSSFATCGQVYPLFGSNLKPEFDPRTFSSEDLSPDLPHGKRNDALWWKQVQAGKGPSLAEWPLKLRKSRTTLSGGKTPVFGAHQGVTWIDIDGDGWCDVLLSVEPEAAKRPGLPIIVTDASSLLFFDPNTNTFHGGKRGLYFGGSNDGEIGSAFTFYFNKVARRVEVVERIFTSGMFYSSGGWEELHGRLMLKGASITEPLCTDRTVFHDACAANTAMHEEAERVYKNLNRIDHPKNAVAIQKRLAAYKSELAQAVQHVN